MALAISLGDRHRGLTWPNPSVGAVLATPDGRILATGITQPGGRPHAERVAIAQAGAAARGATLFVSLEPCSHHGRTPPCVEAVIAAGIARVVSAIEDPDGRVAGRGHAQLAASGIAVTVGTERAEAERSHRGHVSRVTRGRPWLTLKLARTADGFAGAAGARLRITGPAADARTHMMRAHADAVLVGAGTIEADDPRLDVRLPGLEGRAPVRIVVGGGAALPPAARVLSAGSSRPAWILATRPEVFVGEAERMAVPSGADGRIDLSAALATLGARGITRVLCEGGPTLAEALARNDLVDQVVLLTGPTCLEPGRRGIPAIGPDLKDALRTRFALLNAEEVGADLLELYERN